MQIFRGKFDLRNWPDIKFKLKFIFQQTKKKEKESAMEIKRLLAQNVALIEHLNRLKENFGQEFVNNFDVWINQNSNKLKEIKMLNYMANYNLDDDNNSEENSKKFDSLESEESSEFDSGIINLIVFHIKGLFKY